jgi:hypothetical protein
MTLLEGSFLIRKQHRLYKRLDRVQMIARAMVGLTLWRNGTPQSLPDHPPMNTQLARNAADRAFSEGELTTNLLEQLHFDSPVYPALPTLVLTSTE